MMNLRRSALLVPIVLACSGCPTHLVERPQICGTGSNVGRCTGRLVVPEKYSAKIEDGARIAIDRVFSDEYTMRLDAFIDANREMLEAHPDWPIHDAGQMVAALRSAMDRAGIGTYDGPIAWVKYHTPFVNNLAYEAANGQPARINRWGIGRRSAASIANTIVHEAAHAAGMTHASRNKVCAPPYVLGELVERMEPVPTGSFISTCTWFSNVPAAPANP